MSLPLDFWQRERQFLAAIIRPRIQSLALSGAMAAAQDALKLGIYVDGDLVNEQAAEWARLHTDEVLSQMMHTSERQIGSIVSNWIETPGAKVKDLADALTPVLDNNVPRAWRVAVTETTRAYAQGNDLAHSQAGIAKAAYLPPAHINCRCDLAVMRYRNTWIQFWATNHDEVVCTQPLTTPWGTVSGCRDLNGVCVSEGPHLGTKVR